MTELAVGIDVGGTKIAGALVDREGAIVHEAVVSTLRSATGADPGARATAELAALLLRVATDRDAVGIGIGIGVPEYVDADGCRTSCLVLDWPDELVDAFPFGIDVIVESDVRCAARAETLIGHGAGHGSCIYVSIGTGISHTFVIDGDLWRGSRGEAIALGELRVSTEDCLVPESPMTVEGQASGRALERVAARLGVAPLADDPDLDRARDRAGQTVGAAIADLVAVLDPAIVVIGGGLGTTVGTFGTSLANRYALATSVRPSAPPLVTSALGDRAGMIGAGLLVHGA